MSNDNNPKGEPGVNSLTIQTAIDQQNKDLGRTVPLENLLAEFVAHVREVNLNALALQGPSRNWHGLELVKKLGRQEDLSAEEKSKVLFFSCDNGSDGIGSVLEINTVSLSPNSLQPPNLNNSSFGQQSPDLMLEHINEGVPVFQFTAETLEMLKQKQAIVFVGDGLDVVSSMLKFEAFVKSDFIQHLIKQKYVFLAIGQWDKATNRFTYDVNSTNECVKDVNSWGQDVWS